MDVNTKASRRREGVDGGKGGREEIEGQGEGRIVRNERRKRERGVGSAKTESG